MTIFENINAGGEYFISPMLVMQGHELMKSWFSEYLPEGTKILTSENGFTFDKIALEYLQHFIDNSDATPDGDWKLMLMDNHGSHITPEFALLADKYHIRPYSLISHLTHCMQLLDVVIFRQYKHYHDVAIQNAMAEFNVEYSMVQLCRDLTWIQNNTFKKHTIQSAFEKSGMWPVDASQCIAQLKKYVPDAMQQEKNRKIPDLSLSASASEAEPVLLRIQPQTLTEVEYGLNQWKTKIDADMQWSDPVRDVELNQYVSHTRQIIAESHFKDYELSLHQKRRHDEIMQKAIFRKRIKPVSDAMGIIKKNALTVIAEKRRKEEEVIKKKKHNNFMRLWRMKRNDVFAKGIIARRDEKARLKRIRDYNKQEIRVPDEDVTPIIDPEVEFKTSNITWLAEEAKKTKKKHQISANQHTDEENEKEEFIIDTVDDANLRNSVMENHDFVAFEDTDSSDEDVQANLGSGEVAYESIIVKPLAWI